MLRMKGNLSAQLRDSWARLGVRAKTSVRDDVIVLVKGRMKESAIRKTSETPAASAPLRHYPYLMPFQSLSSVRRYTEYNTPSVR